MSWWEHRRSVDGGKARIRLEEDMESKKIKRGTATTAAMLLLIVTGQGVLAPRAAGDIEAGLMGYWSFDDSTTTDFSGQGNNGVFVSGSIVEPLPQWEPGPTDFGIAIRLDGVTFVKIPHNDSLNIVDQITVSAWIRVESFDKDWQAIVTKGESAWRLTRNAGTRTVAFACDGLQGAAARPMVVGTLPVDDRQWHHVAGVYDGAMLRLYMDGVQVATAGAAGRIATNAYPVMIGENAERLGRGFRGAIDEVRIYSRGFGPAEIGELIRPVANLPPNVTVGRDQTFTLRGDMQAAHPVSLAGAVTDDGRPAGGKVTTQWTVVAGPGPVRFENPVNLSTTAFFAKFGVYTLRLTGNDGVFERFHDVTIEIRRAWLPGEQFIRSFTPTPWKAADIPWKRDVGPHNKIDDLIDDSNDGLFDVVVNFKSDVRPADIDWLENIGERSHVQLQLRYLPSVAVQGCTKKDLLSIVAARQVAFVEKQVGFTPSLHVSIPNICVTPAAGGCAWTVPAGIDGSGVNIVIMDSGVDNTVHNAFGPAAVTGFDAVTNTSTDPDDDFGHGTHVASIALGQATVGTARGVAPGAGLIDVRVFDAASVYCDTPGLWTRVTDALETIYDNRSTWGVHVINMSFAQCDSSGLVISDGLDAFSQLVDLGESMGIVIVAAAGNSGPANVGLTSPAAATRAITVAASNHMNTVARTDDSIASFSSRGPRNDDGDLDQRDELKPEVTAPGSSVPFDDHFFDNDAADADPAADTQTTAAVAAGAGVTVAVTSAADIAPGDILWLINASSGAVREEITAATSSGPGGTTFTATTTLSHPAGTRVWEPVGIAAAAMNTVNGRAFMAGTSMAAPHVSGLAALIMSARPGINAASVKELIISSAVLPAGTQASLPAADPTWNNRWGWGLVDAGVAINAVRTTDLTFPSHPPTPLWLSPDISHTTLQVGQPATISVNIRNLGPSPATDVRVHFGVHVFSASTPTFYDIATEIVDIPANPTGHTTVTAQWTPQLPDHQCLKVEIGYGPDLDYSNNYAQRNVQVAASPVQFEVRNILFDKPMRIDLKPTLEDPDSGWTYRIDPSFVVLAPSDGPARIEAELYPPVNGKPGSQQTLHVAAVIYTDSIPYEVGGVSIVDSVH